MGLIRSTTACACVIMLWCVTLSAEATAEAAEWRLYEDSFWGYRVEYPASLFTQVEPAEEQGGISLHSPDGAVRLFLFAGPNGSQLDPEGLANELAQIAARVTYRRVTGDWIVLSGYLAADPSRAPGIFYERVELSQDRRSVAGFRLEYPVTLRHAIDPLIGRIGGSLTPPVDGVTLGGPPFSSTETLQESSIAAPGEAGAAGGNAHAAWCLSTYRTYNPATDTFKRYDGVQVPCISPSDESPEPGDLLAAGPSENGEPSALSDEPPRTEMDLQPALPTVGLTSEAVNAAEFAEGTLPEGLSALTLKLQIILDQLGMSPGVIDGVNGKNVAKAIAGAEVLAGLPVDGVLDEEIWKRLPRDTPILVDYEITPEDVVGPFLAGVPNDFADMAKLDRLSYTGSLEMFGERFHMDVDLLQSLNPGADFNLAGTHIIVATANKYGVTNLVATLVADKVNAQLRGYDQDGNLVVAYPATIGSDELPSPTGTHFVNSIAKDAAYYYNPKINFQQGGNTELLTIPPGPNNPIGTTWIDLSEPTYGIHGTPEPSRIDKTYSHGCVRLTNWDVEELAGLVAKGVPVEFQ